MDNSQDEINKLKRELSAENYMTSKKDKNSSVKIDKKNFNINDFNNINEEMQKINKSVEIKVQEPKTEKKENDNNKQDISERNVKEEENLSEKLKEKTDSSKELAKDEYKNEKENENENEDDKESSKSKEEEKNEEESIQELIPLSYRCLNLDHGEKYITLDRKKQNLICKNCYLSGALETNLELNQPFIDQYMKEEEQKKLNEESPQNVIKETSEESKNSESVEKINKSISNEEDNKSKEPEKIKCLTFQCENKPYYFCEACQDFICYKCLMQRMNEQTDKSRHYYHDVESVNYESNSFNDDIKLNLETIKKIDFSLDYLIKNEKTKAETVIEKLKDESRVDLANYIKNINKNISLLFSENNKILYSKYMQNTFNGSDNTIKEIKLSNVSTKSKIEEILEELNHIKISMNNKDITNEEKCELHQKQLELLKIANSLLQKGNRILQQSREELNYLNNENTKKKFEDEDSLSIKVLFDNEKSLLQNVLNTSKKQGSYKLNRFVTYKHQGLKYFGVSSLELTCEKDIILCGLFLCGKYLSSKIIKKNDYSTIPMEQRGFLNINIKVYEKNKKEALIDEDKKLYEVININDPIVDIIFEKGVKMKKDVKYIIVVENLEKEKFSDIWIGNILNKNANINKDTIRCNSSGINFTFYISQDFNSDFSEFDQGIIEGILYGN